LGYDQPPFQGWLLGFLDSAFGYQRWVVFLASQALVAICLWAVWRLARLIVTPLGALLSVMLLDGILFFNFASPNLFPDLIELPFWALATWSFYRALRFGRLLDWLLLGLCLAGAAYGKYVSFVLALVMVGFMLLEPQARRVWRTPGPYLCAALCLLLLVPHLWWASRHNFPTIAHIDQVSRPTRGILDHIVALGGFVGGELGLICLAGFLLLTLALSQADNRKISLAGPPTIFDRRFVAAMALGPIGLLLAGAVVSDVEFRVHWAYAMWCFIGLFAVVFLVPVVDKRAVRRFPWAWAGVFVLVALLFAGANGFASRASPLRLPSVSWEIPSKHVLRRLQREADFPAHQLANAITEGWQQRIGAPLAYVIGNKRIAGNISFFSTDHPLVLRDGNPEGSPWINMTDLRRQGAVVVWEPDDDTNNISTSLQQRFPSMEMQPPILIPSPSNPELPPRRFLWGILAPAAPAS
jgi:4-amino-4-deoxy-L-arabinose transferase-like glycosyltransferase